MAKSFDAVVTMDISAPIQTVWSGITDPDTIAQYMMGAIVETDWAVGHPITWSGEANGKAFQDKGEILAVDQPHLLRVTHWSPLSDETDSPENYHVITYALSETGGVSTITLTQSNNPTQDAAEAMARDGWTPMLETLKKILEQHG